MASFPSQDDLQTHYQQDHLEPGANYLCPVCKARLNTAADLELHYAANHSSSSAARTNIGVDSLMQEINQLNASLNEERLSNNITSFIQDLIKILLSFIPGGHLKN